MTDTFFQPLTDELDAWAALGREATLWWRDDDAADRGAALERLLHLQGTRAVPLGLAVVPMAATPALAAAVLATPAQNTPDMAAPGVAVLQHGYAHRNHAPDTEKKIELGTHRRADHVIGELGMGWQRLEDLFGDRAVAALVPPWNRIAPYLVPILPEIGYSGLSAFTPRAKARPVARLTQVNTHADIMTWRPTRAFAGAAIATARIVEHLEVRRQRHVPDPDEPTGILTHHLVHDDAAWRYLDSLFACLNEHPAARWLTPHDLFGRAG